MLYLPILVPKFGGIYGIKICWGQNYAKIGLCCEDGNGGREAPLWNILTNRRISIFVPPLVGGSDSEVVELDGGWGYVSGELMSPAALHP